MFGGLPRAHVERSFSLSCQISASPSFTPGLTCPAESRNSKVAMSGKSEVPSPVDSPVVSTPVASSASRDESTNSIQEAAPVVPAAVATAQINNDDALEDQEAATLTAQVVQDSKDAVPKTDADASSAKDDDADAKTEDDDEDVDARVPGSLRGLNETAADYL